MGAGRPQRNISSVGHRECGVSIHGTDVSGALVRTRNDPDGATPMPTLSLRDCGDAVRVGAEWSSGRICARGTRNQYKSLQRQVTR